MVEYGLVQSASIPPLFNVLSCPIFHTVLQCNGAKILHFPDFLAHIHQMYTPEFWKVEVDILRQIPAVSTGSHDLGCLLLLWQLQQSCPCPVFSLTVLQDSVGTFCLLQSLWKRWHSGSGASSLLLLQSPEHHRSIVSHRSIKHVVPEGNLGSIPPSFHKS